MINVILGPVALSVGGGYWIGVNPHELDSLTGVKVRAIRAVLSGQNWKDVTLD